MKQKYLLLFGIITALALTGCQSGSTDAETEALREQISQLQQQINDLEQQQSSESDSGQTGSLEQQPSAAPETSAEDNVSSASTTHTIEELTALVSDYEEKVNAVVSADSADDLEQFMTLKQEEKKIDDDLDLHEDELEYLYRSSVLSRDDYKTLEHELERLEDRLDDAEDTLEYHFGMDD